MREPFLNIGIVVGIVIILNLLISLFKSEHRFWRIPIVILGLFTTALILGTVTLDKLVEQADKEYWTSAEGKIRGDDELWQEMQNSRKESVELKATLFHLVLIQTILTFALQMFGFRMTDKKRLYGSTATIFGLLTITAIILELIKNILPYGIVR